MVTCVSNGSAITWVPHTTGPVSTAADSFIIMGGFAKFVLMVKELTPPFVTLVKRLKKNFGSGRSTPHLVSSLEDLLVAELEVALQAEWKARLVADLMAEQTPERIVELMTETEANRKVRLKAQVTAKLVQLRSQSIPMVSLAHYQHQNTSS